MATLLVKFTDESQYDAATASITYTDPSPNRWTNVFSKLVAGDNCIFHSSSNKLYVGDFDSFIPNVSVTFSNVRVTDITLDDFLRISEIIPETLSEFKRPKNPILRTNSLDINKIYNAALNKDFISFYVVKQGIEMQILSSLKDGDRVITIDSKNRLGELFKKVNGVFNQLILGQNYFNAKGKTLDELSAIMRAANKSNHLANIQRIKNGLANNNSYKFPSFNDYYNVIHNKKAYSKTPPLGGGGNNYGADALANNSYNMALNRILFGPPGTGKTFHSITHAVAIIDGELIEDLYEESTTAEGRNRIKNRYNELMADDRIVFTTFHQSLSYEDFIEGIKPVAPLPDDEFLKYRIEDGIFKLLCDKARQSLELCMQDEDSEDDEMDDLSETVPDNPEPTPMTAAEAEEKGIPDQSAEDGNPVAVESFDDRYGRYIDHISSVINTANRYNVNSKRGTSIFQIQLLDGEISVTGETINNTPQKVSKETLRKLDENILNHHIRNIGKEIRKYAGGYHSIQWSVLNDFRRFYGYVNAIAQPNAANFPVLLKSDENADDSTGMPAWISCPKYVIILDEINRGNVSQIFGELITLIEEDKRELAKEALSITLPYSKHPFSVPPNLYIIGTMNTADRSVEALDTALRRRFSFIPMMPEYRDLSINCEGVNLHELLRKMNERLTILKDRDHTIGHAWLWNVKSLNDLRKAFKDKIIPLLQEYFYNDYEKLGLVLGNRFVTEELIANQQAFANFPIGSTIKNQYNNKKVLNITDSTTWDLESFKSIYEPPINNV